MSRRTGASRQTRSAGSGKLKAYLAGLATGLIVAFLAVSLGIFDKKGGAGGENVAAENSSDKSKTARSQTKFDFYTVLPEQEVEVVVNTAPATGKAAEKPATTVPPPAVIEAPAAPVQTAEKSAPIVDLSVRAESATAATKPVEKVANNSTAKVTKFLQAGSFSRQIDADKRRAELLIHGFRASTDTVRANGETRYRVQIGPFASDAEVNKARANLKANGIDTFVTSRK